MRLPHLGLCERSGRRWSWWLPLLRPMLTARAESPESESESRLALSSGALAGARE